MNILETCHIVGPYGKSEDCAQFTIDTPALAFVLSDTMIAGEKYSMSLWIKSDNTTTLRFGGTIFPVTTDWTKLNKTFTATGDDLRIIFGSASTYYIYHVQLERGDKVTDWSPAPEDSEGNIESLQESISSLIIGSGAIEASVSDLDKKFNNVSKDLETTTADVASLKLTSDGFKVSIQSIKDEGVSKLDTGTGFTFDKYGLTIDENNSDTKTVIDDDGMVVRQKSTNTDVLTATSEGVTATDLNARTYLIVGGRSRFENFGTNRTGCFWIGEEVK